MPSEKSRPINPAAAQRKLEKTRALRKSKAAIQAQRTTRLATRNPLRLEQTIASLKSRQDSQGGKLGPQEKKALEDAERDLVRVRKAREAVGLKDGGPPGRIEGGGGERGGGGRGRGAGGQVSGVKRLRKEMEGKNKGEQESEEEEEEKDEETDEDVRRIPMPRDTPPPIPPRPHLHPASTSASASNANLEPLGPARLPLSSYTPGDTTTTTPNTSQSPASASAPAPAPAIIKVYESAPQVRDLRREAVASFVPEVVRRKLDAVRGKGKLLEEEELRELEKGGYTNVVGGGGRTSATGGEMKKKKDRGDKEEEEEEEFRKEEERFEREVRMVASVEEVDDEDEWWKRKMERRKEKK